MTGEHRKTDRRGYRAFYSRDDYLRDVSIATRLVVRYGHVFFPEILGSAKDLLLPRADKEAILSEFMLHREDGRTVGWAVEYLSRFVLPRTPWTGPGWFERRPLTVCRDVCGCGDDWHSVHEARGEAWFYVNGILNDEVVARLGAQRLAGLFHRQVTLLANPTDGVVTDLVECVDGRTLEEPGQSAIAVAAEVAVELRAGKRVVLVGHSQGCIISASVVHILIEQGYTPEELQRLEVYLFASPVAEVRATETADGTQVPYVEHYANEHDLVAKLGATWDGWPDLSLRGRVLFRPGKWGHVLNAHYLDAYGGEEPVYTDAEGPGRLRSYLAGEQPPLVGVAEP